MSKLIVEMEMPKHGCCDCMVELMGLCVIQDKDVPLKNENGDYPTELPKGCPIIGVLPEQHGRLGDLDRLANMVNGLRIDAMLKGSDTNPYWLLGDIIAQAKTIVPAAERSEP